MKRQIKFRGKLINSEQWMYGGYYYHKPTDEQRIIAPTLNVKSILNDWNVQPESIGQFTGLLDRNGKEIYDGDIITVRGNYPRVILWDKVSWAIMPCELYNDKHFWVMNLQHPGSDWWELFADEIDVVGNIYDNPELLDPDSQWVFAQT